jgi:hypothetical protein
MNFSAQFDHIPLQRKLVELLGANFSSDVEVEVTVSVSAESSLLETDEAKTVVADAIKEVFDLPTINIEGD